MKKIMSCLNVFLLTCLTCGVLLPSAPRSRLRRPGQPKQVVIAAPVVEDDIDIDTEDEEAAGGEQPQVVSEEIVTSSEDDHVYLQEKKKQVMALIEKGIAYLKKNSAAESFHEFSHTKNFIQGELYLFVLDSKGVSLANGEQNDLLWKNLYDLRDSYGTPFVRQMIEKAQKGGGWITYQWRNAAKVSYVQEVKKDGRSYVIGCGFYPHSKSDAVVNLVKGAVALFNDLKAKGRPKDEAFSSYNYSMGRFVFGDLYLYALDFKGNIVAQAERPGLVGINSLDYKDAEGKFVNQEIINRLKETPDDGVWITYVSKRSHKKAYAERVVDAKGTNYFIACGYYPDANREEAVKLVKKGYQYMKAHGKGLAVQDFTSKQSDAFRYGDLYLIVYNLNGVCVAHGSNSELLNQSLWDTQDDDGRHYVREIIEKAKKDLTGWIDYKTKNSFQSVYLELVDLGVEKYVITCGTYPISKEETMNLLIKSGVSYLKANPEEVAFQEFTNINGKFIRGDLMLFVFDPRGLCYAWGDDFDLIWQNLMAKKDDDSKSYVKLFINTVEQGPGKVTYKIDGGTKIGYVDKVIKADRTFIVGSSYFK